MRVLRLLIALAAFNCVTAAIAQDALPTIPMEGFWPQKAFGLVLGQSREDVAAVVEGFAPAKESLFQNAYTVSRLPNENLGIRYPYTIVSRTIYFDDLGGLWRIRIALGAGPKATFNPEDAFMVYYALKDALGKDKGFDESVEQAPYVKQNLEACGMDYLWELVEPKAFAAAEAKAPSLSFTQRVVFDIACGAIKNWSTKFTSQRVEYDVIMGFGSIDETPVILTVAKGDKKDIRVEQKIQRMLKPSAKKQTEGADDPAGDTPEISPKK